MCFITSHWYNGKKIDFEKVKYFSVLKTYLPFHDLTIGVGFVFEVGGGAGDWVGVLAGGEGGTVIIGITAVGAEGFA